LHIQPKGRIFMGNTSNAGRSTGRKNVTASAHLSVIEARLEEIIDRLDELKTLLAELDCAQANSRGNSTSSK
jgi:hypothetical protein